MTCVGEPISWLRLERYALAELDRAAAAAVRMHVEACAACRSALASIEGDVVALPPLPARRAVIAAVKRPWYRRWTLGAGLGVAIAAAAVLLLWLRTPGDDALPGRRARVKGAGLVSLRLVRERGGVVAFDPADVAPDDRWKVELTCASGAPLWTDVVVYQPGGASFPLSPRPITCGNQVGVPGAFRITDGGATICVALGSAAPDRLRLARGPRGPMVCAAVAVLDR
jgi:hypothetical protein